MRRRANAAVTAPDSFAERLVGWYERAGRKDLPWQREPTPYRVWISEIMLQQTQVKTVIPYYQRFMERFPDIRTLAEAPLDAVLHVWSGLGYYARARHLHDASRIVRDRFAGRFPTHIADLIELPGVGRSTAAAILALSRGDRYPILDGNVKRVLTRYHAIEGWPGTPAAERRLWDLAELRTPLQRVAHYTQAIMDLGATVCTRATPRCNACPLNADCQARRLGRQVELPARRPRKNLPVRQTTFMIVRNVAGEVLLEQRPPAGLWGGLWGFPECVAGTDPAAWCQSALGSSLTDLEYWPTLRHNFSHFHLDITPAYMRISEIAQRVMEPRSVLWYNNACAAPVGLAAPVAKLLQRLAVD